MNDNPTDLLSNTQPLASLSDRLAASLLDVLIMVIIIAVPLFLIYGFDEALRMLSQENILHTVTKLAFGQIVFLLVQGRLLYKYGQTIGKRYLDIRIVDLNNNLPSFGRVYALRYLLGMSVVPAVPIIGGLFSLVDTLFIFRSDRRCIHDLIAGTKVVAA